MKKNKDGLLPCPFCARQPEFHSFPTGLLTVVCKCGAESPSDSKTKNAVRQKWNRRRYIPDKIITL